MLICVNYFDKLSIFGETTWECGSERRDILRETTNRSKLPPFPKMMKGNIHQIRTIIVMSTMDGDFIPKEEAVKGPGLLESRRRWIIHQSIHAFMIRSDWRMQMQSLIDFMNGNTFIDRFHEEIVAAPQFSVISWNWMKNANAFIDQFYEWQCIHWSISWYRRDATIFSVFME